MNRPSYAVSIPEIERNARPNCTERQVRHLNQMDVANRWNMSVRTLERWRWSKQGPKFVKLGGRVLYRLVDIEAFEVANLHLRNADDE